MSVHACPCCACTPDPSPAAQERTGDDGRALARLIPRSISPDRFRRAMDVLAELIGHRSKDWRVDCRNLPPEALAHFLTVGVGLDGMTVLTALEASK